MEVNYETELKHWIDNERLALDLLQVSSVLQLDKSIELVLFRRKVFDKKISELISDHENAARHSKLPITLEITSNLAKAISKLAIAPSRIDLGRLAKEWLEEGKNGHYDAFVTDKLKDFIGEE